jgi:hypothetical protein
MQKYKVEPPGRGTDISRHPCSAARRLLPVKEEKSTRHIVDAYVPVPGLAKPQPVVVEGVIAEPLGMTWALSAGTAASVYEKLPLVSVVLGSEISSWTFVTCCVDVHAISAAVLLLPGRIVGGLWQFVVMVAEQAIGMLYEITVEVVGVVEKPPEQYWRTSE